MIIIILKFILKINGVLLRSCLKYLKKLRILSGIVKQNIQTKHKKMEKYRLHRDFLFDLSKSMPNMAYNQMKIGLKLQAKSIASMRSVGCLLPDWK